MKQVYLNPLPVRLWHWLNALSFLVLIVTGLQIRYRDILHLASFKTVVDIHNIFGFVLLFSYGLWLAYYLFTGKIKVYIPDLNVKRWLAKAIPQARYYGYGIFIGEPNPHHATPDNKFNPLQQMGYLSIMALLIPLQLVTGFLMWDVKGFASIISFVGGIRLVDTVHVLLTMFFSAFLYVHIYLSMLGRTPAEHIESMVTGFEEEPEHHPAH